MERADRIKNKFNQKKYINSVNKEHAGIGERFKTRLD